MTLLIELLKSLLLGIVEGITEWLPISSTGHMILVNEFIGNEGFTASDLYIYVIQLGAILAVVTLYFHKLNPFSPKKTAAEKADTWQMWFKVIVACVPALRSTISWINSKIGMLCLQHLFCTVSRSCLSKRKAERRRLPPFAVFPIKPRFSSVRFRCCRSFRARRAPARPFWAR